MVQYHNIALLFALALAPVHDPSSTRNLSASALSDQDRTPSRSRTYNRTFERWEAAAPASLTSSLLPALKCQRVLETQI